MTECAITCPSLPIFTNELPRGSRCQTERMKRSRWGGADEPNAGLRAVASAVRIVLILSRRSRHFARRRQV